MLNQLTSIDVEPINVNGATADITTSIDITEFLPEGVSLVNSDEANISVTVKIETYNTTGLVLSTNNITVNGLDEENKCSFSNSNVSVQVSGNSTDLAKLSSANLKGTIDVSGLTTGTHMVKVGLSLDTGVYKWNEVSVEVTITKAKANDESDGNNSDSNNSGNNTQNENQSEEENEQ